MPNPNGNPLGRPPAGSERSLNAPPPPYLKKIRSRHRIIMFMFLQGDRAVDISKKMNITTARLSTIRKSPLFKMELRKLQKEVSNQVVKKTVNLHDKVEGLAEKSLDVLNDMLDSNDIPPVLKRAVANDIIKRSSVGENSKLPVGSGDVVTDLYTLMLEKAMAESESEIAIKNRNQEELSGLTTDVIDADEEGLIVDGSGSDSDPENKNKNGDNNLNNPNKLKQIGQFDAYGENNNIEDHVS